MGILMLTFILYYLIFSNIIFVSHLASDSKNLFSYPKNLQNKDYLPGERFIKIGNELGDV